MRAKGVELFTDSQIQKSVAAAADEADDELKNDSDCVDYVGKDAESLGSSFGMLFAANLAGVGKCFIAFFVCDYVVGMKLFAVCVAANAANVPVIAVIGVIGLNSNVINAEGHFLRVSNSCFVAVLVLNGKLNDFAVIGLVKSEILMKVNECRCLFAGLFVNACYLNENVLVDNFNAAVLIAGEFNGFAGACVYAFNGNFVKANYVVAGRCRNSENAEKHEYAQKDR